MNYRTLYATVAYVAVAILNWALPASSGSSKVRLIKFWNMDFLLNFMNVASIKLKENCPNIVTWS